MQNNKTVVKNGKELRFGYTTGSCATAASVASAQMLLTGEEVSHISIRLPSGELVVFVIENILISKNCVSCCVTKDGGDDPDATHGIKIYSKAVKTDCYISVQGGQGVGFVTKKGLRCPVGTHAINPVPRKMITENVQNLMDNLQYKKGLELTISVPEGEEVAKKTFNPRLGIEGGISILGTTGIVEPMSEKALIDTIKVLVDQHYSSNPDYILIAPGNYGQAFCKEVLNINLDKGIKCSNFIGETLDYLCYKGFKKVLLVGHLGKMVKLSGGIMNTHSSTADCRAELLALHYGLAGGSLAVMEEIMDCTTTDAIIDILEREKITEIVLGRIMDKIKFHIDYRVKSQLQVEVVLFSQNNSIYASTKNSKDLISLFLEEK